jgi:16S rRNA (cytosine1402-N4)-methyltransferase
MALRIAVNDEMGELERFLRSAPGLLSKGGRLVVMSYHSLEDRRVKARFRELEKREEFELPVRRSVVPGRPEVERNPRSRSAKLRVLERMS